MTLSRAERKETERIGVPYIVAAIILDWETELPNIEMITDKERQYKGEDYVIDDGVYRTVIDSKFHMKKAYKQNLTEYGVDVLSIEITKRNGRKGWGIDTNLNTDYIIDMIYGIGYYIIDSKRLKEYMIDMYTKYPIMYSEEGEEDYRAVSVADLMEYEVILYYKEFEEIEDLALEYINEKDDNYNNYIKHKINEL